MKKQIIPLDEQLTAAEAVNVRVEAGEREFSLRDVRALARGFSIARQGFKKTTERRLHRQVTTR